MTETFGPHPETIKSVYNFAPTALEELALWLETRGLRQSLSSMLGSGDLVRSSTSTYTAYTPTWTSSGTPPAIGNSTVVGRYIKVGKLVHCYGSIVFGNTATFGTGSYYFALPVTASTSVATSFVGNFYLYDSSANAIGQAIGYYQTASTVKMLYGGTYLGTNSEVAATAPWTWATPDQIGWNIVYEAA